MKTLQSRLEQLEASHKQARTRVFSDAELAIRMARILLGKPPGYERLLDFLARCAQPEKTARAVDGGVLDSIPP